MLLNVEGCESLHFPQSFFIFSIRDGDAEIEPDWDRFENRKKYKYILDKDCILCRRDAALKKSEGSYNGQRRFG